MKTVTKNRIRFLISASVMLVTCASTGAADELLWKGGSSATWNTSDQNWLSGGETVAFSSGSDVRFDDGTAVTNVTISGTLSAGAVVFSNSFNYLLAGSKLDTVTSFVKSGTGKLTITNDHTFVSDMLVDGGELIADAKADVKNATSGALGNPRAVRTITVTNNAALTFKWPGTFGAGTSTTRILTTLDIVGGTLNLPSNWGTTLGPVIFDNATLTYSGGQPSGARYWGTAIFSSNAVFRGTNVYNFPVVGTEANCGFTFGKYEPSDLIVEDITGNANSEVKFALPIGYTPGTDGVNTRFNKKGPGTLELSYPKNFYTGDVRVVEGTLFLNAQQASLTNAYSPLGNPRVPHNLYVGTNAVLHFNLSDVMGQAYSRSLITIEVDGGTLKQTATKVNSFGPLILNNAKLDYSDIATSGGGAVKWGTFYFDGDVLFKGTNAYTLSTVSGSLMRCGINGMVYFTPEDITGNANPDVTIDMQIDDGPYAYGTFTNAPVSNFGKKGAGTLRLGGTSIYKSTFSGNIEVAEGVLEIVTGGGVENRAYSCVGNPQVANRQMLVHSGSELYFYASDTLGQLASSVKMATIISNATLRLANGKCNGFGPLTLYNAKLIYNGGSYSSGKTWGVMGLGGKTVFDGTNAYTIAEIGSYCRFSLGYGLDFEITYPVGKTNYNGKTEFEVRDITADANTDVNFEAALQDIPTWTSGPLFKTVTFKCGLLKSGTGTLRLASTSSTYSGPTVVTQGVLRVDGSLTASEVTVKSGGCLGGTGTVSTVTLEDGARFDVFANQSVPLKVTSLTMVNGGMIVVHNPTGLGVTALNASFLQVSGGGFDPAKWTVIMDGVAATPSLRVRMDNGVVYARWSPSGTLVVVK